jgi:phosphate starvation-inducible PhoH-like protein
LNASPDSLHPSSTDIHLEPADNLRLANLCGSLDKNLRHIERRLGVEINNRGNAFRIIGTIKSVNLAEHVLQSLYQMTAAETLSPEKVHLHLQDVGVNHGIDNDEDADTSIKTKRGIIRGRTPNQRAYLNNIIDNDISFGIGPAGTGKTYLAVACAIAALEQDRARRIVLVRPAVEAGENLGFLPGDLIQKVDPYLRPLYDALYEMLGFEQVAKCIERNVIEVAPLAFMRGRTLNESFVILDEAQNTTVEQMKMFLTRIGFGSTAVITGDITQIDLPRGKDSGLRQVIDILKDEEDISFTFFNTRDVVRHPLVAKILDAYERHEQSNPTNEH